MNEVGKEEFYKYTIYGNGKEQDIVAGSYKEAEKIAKNKKSNIVQIHLVAVKKDD